MKIISQNNQITLHTSVFFWQNFVVGILQLKVYDYYNGSRILTSRQSLRTITRADFFNILSTAQDDY